MKYIDADELKNKVNKLRQDWLGNSTGLEVAEEGAELGAAESILDSLDDIIDSLQQEQPEVDLENEIQIYSNYLEENGLTAPLEAVARHFWNKGYNARKEENK